jgi:hypothetical protein
MTTAQAGVSGLEAKKQRPEDCNSAVLIGVRAALIGQAAHRCVVVGALSIWWNGHHLTP